MKKQLICKIMIDLAMTVLLLFLMARQITGELSDEELLDLKGFVNTIITHITNGNKNEERTQEVR